MPGLGPRRSASIWRQLDCSSRCRFGAPRRRWFGACSVGARSGAGRSVAQPLLSITGSCPAAGNRSEERTGRAFHRAPRRAQVAAATRNSSHAPGTPLRSWAPSGSDATAWPATGRRPTRLRRSRRRRPSTSLCSRCSPRAPRRRLPTGRCRRRARRYGRRALRPGGRCGSPPRRVGRPGGGE